jgi:RNA polymerase sigma factor (sigma-70 family)
LEAQQAHRAPHGLARTGGRFVLARGSDERLVELVRQGNVAAFETLYDRYHLRILSFCRHMLGSQPDGEDATQHAFVALHRHLTTDERPVDVKPWLFQVARNRCLSILRSRREHADADDPAFQPATEGLADSVQRRADLRAMLTDLQQLPEEQRAALLLSSLGDLSGDEIADVVGCRPQKVKALVFQARTALMNEREARDTDCATIREQLATLRGGSLLRGPLRRHVRACDGCRAFRDQTRHQREAMALLLPVIPTAGLKAATMSAAVGGAATAIGGGAALSGGSGVIAALTAGGKAGAAKILVVAALAGTGVGAGVAEVNHLRKPSKPAAPAVRHNGAPAAVKGSPALAPATSTPTATDPGSSANAHGKAHGKTSKGTGHPTTSPATSPNAATGKGISGTQPGHGSGTTGKAGAPGQLKNQGTAKSHGTTKTHKPKAKPQPVHTKPAPQPKPKVTPAPASPAVPPGQTKDKPQVQAPAAVKTVTEQTG